jgi:hypothetical protein
MLIEVLLAVFTIISAPYLLICNLPSSGVTFITRWTLGLVTTSYLVAAFHAFNLSKQSSYSIILVLLTLSALYKAYSSRKNFCQFKLSGFKLRIVDLLFFLGLVIFASHGFLLVLSDPISAWDAVAIWYQKTLAYYYWAPLEQIPTLNYPNLFPIFWSFILTLNGNLEGIGRLIFPLIYNLFFLEIYLIFKTNSKKDFYLCAALLYLASIFRNDLTYNGYQDAALLAVAGIATANFIKIYISASTNPNNLSKLRINFYYALALLGSLGFIKNEGLIFSLILLIIPLIITVKFNIIRNYDYLILSVLYFILLLFWQIILYFYHVDLNNIQGDAFKLNSISDLLTQTSRTPVITQYYKSFFSQYYLIISGSVLLSLMAVVLDFSKAWIIGSLWLITFLHSLFILCVFLLTKQDLAWHLDSAFSRLMYQSCFIYILLAISIILPQRNESRFTS